MVRPIRRLVTLLAVLLAGGSVTALVSQQPAQSAAPVAASPLGPVAAPFQRPAQPKVDRRLPGLPAKTAAHRDATIHLTTVALVVLVVILVLVLL